MQSTSKTSKTLVRQKCLTAFGCYDSRNIGSKTFLGGVDKNLYIMCILSLYSIYVLLVYFYIYITIITGKSSKTKSVLLVSYYLFLKNEKAVKTAKSSKTLFWSFK